MKMNRAGRGWMAAQAVMRFAIIACLFYAASAQGAAAWAFIAAVLAAIILFVMPCRFICGRVLGDYAQGRTYYIRAGYALRLKQGFFRLYRGLRFCLPLLLYCAGLFYVLNELPYNTMYKIIKPFSYLVFSSPSTDSAVFGVLIMLALLALAAAYGWRRDMAMEYLADTAEMRKAQLLQETKKAMKDGRKRFLKVTAVNILLTLPAIIAFGAVLLPYLAQHLKAVQGDNMRLLMQVMEVMKKPLPLKELALLTGVYFLLYTPLCIVRKYRIGKAVRQITQGK